MPGTGSKCRRDEAFNLHPSSGTPPRRREGRPARRLPRLIAALAITLAVTLTAPITGATATTGEGHGHPHVASPHAKVSGLRLNQWLETFWKVGLSQPTDQNPIVGNGDLCPVVHGVLIHYGIFRETCTIPEGTPVLLVSVIGPECSTNEPGDFGADPSEAGLLACASRIRVNFRDEAMTLDGHPVRRLSEHLIETQRFDVTFAEDNPFDATPGPGFSAAVGTAVIFKNLKPGPHTFVNTITEHEPPNPDEEITGTARVQVTTE